MSSLYKEKYIKIYKHTLNSPQLYWSNLENRNKEYYININFLDTDTYIYIYIYWVPLYIFYNKFTKIKLIDQKDRHRGVVFKNVVFNLYAGRWIQITNHTICIPYVWYHHFAKTKQKNKKYPQRYGLPYWHHSLSAYTNIYTWNIYILGSPFKTKL